MWKVWTPSAACATTQNQSNNMENFYNVYLQEYGTEPTNIVELGSRDGDDAEKLRVLAKLPPQDVYIAEAHPDCAKGIRAKYPLVNLYPVAIYSQAGILDFNAIDINFDKGYVGTSSLLKRNIDIVPLEYAQIVKDQEKNMVKVIGITGKMLLELINRPMIDMMKIDVEGVTLDVLKSFGDDLRLVKLLHIESEVVPMWHNGCNLDDTVNIMTHYGFKEVFRIQTYYQQIDTIWRRLD
jgi:FkbM family methyltransferase